MKKKTIFILWFIAIICILTLNNIVYAKEANNLYKTYVVVDDITSDWENFHPENDSICGDEYDSRILYEKHLDANNADYKDVFSGNHGTKRNFTVRYYWLHALDSMVKHIESVDYKQISEKNSVDELKKVVEVTRKCAYNIGTFAQTDDDKISDEVGFFNDFKVTDSRSYNAFKNITGAQSDDVDKELKNYYVRVQDCIREMQAACDYKADSPVYGKDSGVSINDSYQTKFNYNEQQIKAYWRIYGGRMNVGNNRDGLERKWQDVSGTTLEEQKEIDDGLRSTVDEDIKNAQYEEGKKEDSDKDTIFNQPVGTAQASNGAEDAMKDAEKFLLAGDKDIIAQGNLQEFSQNLYGILLAVGVVIAVIIGVILGVKLMLAPVGEKAEAKKLLIPYVVGCVVVFGAFGIWKLVVTIMQGI